MQIAAALFAIVSLVVSGLAAPQLTNNAVPPSSSLSTSSSAPSTSSSTPSASSGTPPASTSSGTPPSTITNTPLSSSTPPANSSSIPPLSTSTPSQSASSSSSSSAPPPSPTPPVNSITIISDAFDILSDFETLQNTISVLPDSGASYPQLDSVSLAYKSLTQTLNSSSTHLWILPNRLGDEDGSSLLSVLGNIALSVNSTANVAIQKKYIAITDNDGNVKVDITALAVQVDGWYQLVISDLPASSSSKAVTYRNQIAGNFTNVENSLPK